MTLREAEARPSVHVGYVLKKYPRLSETFILNELLGLEGLGTRVSIASLRLPDDGRFHADVARLQAAAHYLPEYKSIHAYTAMRSLAGFAEPGPSLERALDLLDRMPESRRMALLVQGIALADYARSAGIEHLHAHFMTIASHAAFLASCFTGIPFSVTAHAKDIFRHTVDAETFREVADAAHRIVTVTDFNRRFIADRFLDGDTSKVIRIYNGLPVEELRTLAGDGVEYVEDREAPPRILAVGRLVAKKGFPVLLDACRRLADRDVRFTCRVIGEGEEAMSLERRIDELKLRGIVDLAGPQPRERVLEAMGRAAVLAAPCVPSPDGNQDALPTVLLEAMAVGLPVVSTSISGIPEIVDSGVDGLLVEPESASRLADALELLLKDVNQRAEFARAGRRKVEDRFDRRKTLPQLMALFAESAGARRSELEGAVT